MKKAKLKVSNFSLDSTIKTEQCPADLWYFDNFLKCWISYIPIGKKWYKVLLRQRNKGEIEIYHTSVNSVSVIEKLNYIFWLDYDIEDLFSTFSNDKFLKKVFNKCKGLRVMRDLDKEYRILEAILTQNTSIKQIKKMQRLLFINYGKKENVNKEEIFTYPRAKDIAIVKEEDLKSKCKLGYRASYLKKIAESLIQGDLSLEKIESLSTPEAREYLIKFKGIGRKVADIILMYGFGRRDVFPLDLWVKKAIKREYFGNRDVTDREIHNFAIEYFGAHASIINLMIFNAERGGEKEFYNLCVWR